MSRFGHILPYLRIVSEALGPNYVYVMVRTDGLVKIGRSVNPEKRRKDIAIRHKCLVDLVHKKNFGRNASHAENILHKNFSTYRVTGEWFQISVEKAVVTLNTIFDKISGTDLDLKMELPFSLQDAINKGIEQLRQNTQIQKQEQSLIALTKLARKVRRRSQSMAGNSA